jgi:RecA-family ATPase
MTTPPSGIAAATHTARSDSARSFIVDKIFPTGRIHLIFGPDSSDKTILMLQILRDWLRSEPIFDHPSFPAKYCWISCERESAGLRDSMLALGMTPSETYHYSLLELDRASADVSNLTIDTAVLQAQRQAQQQHGLVLFIDGLHTLCEGKIIDTRDVSRFLERVGYLIRRNHMTIIATVASPKSRPEDSTAPPRERFLGSGAWASMTDTKILIEPVNAANAMDAARKITVLPSLLYPQIFRYERHEDGLIFMAQGDVPLCPLDDWLEMQPTTEILSTKMIQMAGESLELSRATITRWIKRMVEENRLDSTMRGLYKIIPRP